MARWRVDRGGASGRYRGQQFGVGAQVIVRLERSDGIGMFQDDPVGVIVAPGHTLGMTPYAPPTADDPSWIVQFEEPFSGLDGSGPHRSARVPERLLELAPDASPGESGDQVDHRG